MNNNTNQNIFNNNQPKSFITISSDLPINSLNQILEKNPNLVNIIDNKGETILSNSIKKKKIDICQLILNFKILDLSFQDKNGNSYLHLAIMKQLERIVKVLIEKGINVNMQNNDGNTPLHCAYLYNSIPIIDILRNNNKVDKKIKNNNNKIAEDLKVNKENNDKLEIENKNNKEKNNKSNKKNKENKTKIPKNEKNQIKIHIKK